MKNFIQYLKDYFNNDDLPFIMEESDVIRTISEVHNELIGNGKHNGDCIGGKTPCKICAYELWLSEYKAYCLNYKNINNVKDS